MESKGQISAEFILIVGFMLVIILLIVGYVAPQVEQNSVLTATREGASNAISGIGYTNTSFTPIRITSMNVTGDQTKTVRISFSRPVPNNYKSYVINKTMTSVIAQGYPALNANTIKGNFYTYTFIVV